MPLAGPGGRATNDSKVIGEHAWGMLKSFNFDPKDLRGIGIQIQKLEPSLAPVNPGQAQLPFKSMESPSKTMEGTGHDPDPRSHPEDDVQVVVHPPSLPSEAVDETDGDLVTGPPRSSDILDLPSFSQIDKDVLNALPGDLRQELEAEYKRRSISPFPTKIPVPPPIKPRSRFTVKGTTNLKRITQQLAPSNRPVMTSPDKNALFKQEGPSAIHISDTELRKLDIDPEVFGILPVELQREQLTLARQAKMTGVSPLKLGERKVIKPYKGKAQSSAAASRRRPHPRANYPQPPTLKQQGKERGTKLYFTEAADVQRVIEMWVEEYKEYPPNARDVEYFSKFLVESVDSSRSTDACLEKAVRVVKWWLVLLRRYWGVWEHAEDGEERVYGEGRVTSEIVGRAWWKAFQSVKEKMDMAARKKFGGCLSLK
jgi:DNA repair protein REV1